MNSNSTFANRVVVRLLLTRLDEIQGTFISLLSDPKSKHLSRESCCLGLAACRGLLQSQAGGNETSADELNSKLLRAFGHTTSYAGSAMQETQSQAAERRRQEASERGDVLSTSDTSGVQTEIGGASGIGEAALGAYREMAAASVAVGRLDILYALLILSVSHPFWFTSETRHRFVSLACRHISWV